MSRLAKGDLAGRGANRANQANRANPPPSDPSPARQVTLQVTYGVGWGDPPLCESGPASGTCDWPGLSMVAGAASL